jgi:hypothetical protein
MLKILKDTGCPIDNRFYEIIKYTKKVSLLVTPISTQKMIEKTVKDITEYYKVPNN